MHRVPVHRPLVPLSAIASLSAPLPISNVTNSNEFMAKDSRVFVGNLNTFTLTKEDVDTIFRRYGILTGISMHKGYAFVQFTHPADARRSIVFENRQVYAGQGLDLNIVSEPKPKQSQKRQAGTISSTRSPVQQSPTTPPVAKRQRQDNHGTQKQSSQRSNLVTLSSSGQLIAHPRSRGSAGRPLVNSTGSAAKIAASAAVKRATSVTMAKIAANATRSVPCSAAVDTGAASGVERDVLICGVCKTQFDTVHSLMQHKKVVCRLRSCCRCQGSPVERQGGGDDDDDDPLEIECAMCDARFGSAWALCQHCHGEHGLTVYRTKNEGKGDAVSDAAGKYGGSSLDGSVKGNGEVKPNIE